MKAKQNEKEGLKVLYQEVKNKLRNTMSKEMCWIRRKEKIKTRQKFLKDSQKFATTLFTEAKSSNLKCTKQELEPRLKITNSDLKGNEELPVYGWKKKHWQASHSTSQTSRQKRWISSLEKHIGKPVQEMKGEL